MYCEWNIMQRSDRHHEWRGVIWAFRLFDAPDTWYVCNAWVENLNFRLRTVNRHRQDVFSHHVNQSQACSSSDIASRDAAQQLQMNVFLKQLWKWPSSSRSSWRNQWDSPSLWRTWWTQRWCWTGLRRFSAFQSTLSAATRSTKSKSAIWQQNCQCSESESVNWILLTN